MDGCTGKAEIFLGHMEARKAPRGELHFSKLKLRTSATRREVEKSLDVERRNTTTGENLRSSIWRPLYEAMRMEKVEKKGTKKRWYIHIHSRVASRLWGTWTVTVTWNADLISKCLERVVRSSPRDLYWSTTPKSSSPQLHCLFSCCPIQAPESLSNSLLIINHLLIVFKSWQLSI